MAAVFVAMFLYVAYVQLMRQPDLDRGIAQITTALYNPLLYLMVLLTLINWSIETYKWKVLTGTLEQHSFLYLFCSVMSGCSVSMVLPNRSGEFAGRILWMKPQNRIAAASASIAGSIAQWMVTVVMGIIGLVMLRSELIHRLSAWSSGVGYYSLLLFTGIAFVLAFVVYWNISWVERRLKTVAFFQKRQQVGLFLKSCSSKKMLIVLAWSIIRYAVFILQYVICLTLFGVDGPLISMMGLVAVFFLLMSVSPAIGLIDLPVRAGVGAFIMGIVSTNHLGIQATTLLIWLLNLALPSIVGMMANTRLITKSREL